MLPVALQSAQTKIIMKAGDKELKRRDGRALRWEASNAAGLPASEGMNLSRSLGIIPLQCKHMSAGEAKMNAKYL